MSLMGPQNKVFLQRMSEPMMGTQDFKNARYENDNTLIFSLFFQQNIEPH